jgi:hypothetical protein
VGELPSYADYASGQVASGLRYLDLSIQTRLYSEEGRELFVVGGHGAFVVERMPSSAEDQKTLFVSSAMEVEKKAPPPSTVSPSPSSG